MSSKHLDSILRNIPSATVQPLTAQENLEQKKQKEELSKVVARIPKTLKNEIRAYLSDKKKETETSLVLKGLKALGFNVNDEWLVDKRTLR